ncbi:hypothetical protein TZ03_11635 [Pseudomonas sp. 10-1B]|nr:hypothetical protein TZ03_11635 [Pseudomonas sp. 10-1B]
MPVSLDQLPPVAVRPGMPRLWLWSGLLMLFLLLGAAGVLVFASQPLAEQSLRIWWLVAAGVLLGWCLLLAVRILHYLGLRHAADGWDQAREEDYAGKINQGRRFVQVLDATLHTGLQVPGQSWVTQLEALLSGLRAIRTQPAWAGDIARHSRLPIEAGSTAEHRLLAALNRVLADLAETLSQLPADVPLAVLLDVDSSLPASEIHRIWQEAWGSSANRQPATTLPGCGLGVLDHWLDQRSEDRSLLLVVSCQVAPSQPVGTAEVAVGLLLGNPLGASTLPPIARLHRPQQACEQTSEAWCSAVDQSLNWADKERDALDHGWRVGIDAGHEPALGTVFMRLPAELDGLVHNLDAMLGHPGRAAPWLALAAATQNIKQGAGVQIIFSGERSAASVLWSTVIVPSPAPAN